MHIFENFLTKDDLQGINSNFLHNFGQNCETTLIIYIMGRKNMSATPCGVAPM